MTATRQLFNYRAVVGIDPSLRSTGLAIIPLEGAVELHRVQSAALPTAQCNSWPLRDARISDIVDRVVERVPPQSLVLMETLFIPSKTSAGALIDRIGLWWRMYHFLADKHSCAVLPVTPQDRMKYMTGKGSAQKDVVLAAVIRRYPDVLVTGNDEADALAMAALGCRWLGSPIEAEPLPKMCLTVLEKLAL